MCNVLYHVCVWKTETTPGLTFRDEHQRATEYSEAWEPFSWSVVQELMAQSISTLATTNLGRLIPEGSNQNAIDGKFTKWYSVGGNTICCVQQTSCSAVCIGNLPLWVPRPQGVWRHCPHGLSQRRLAKEKSAQTLTCWKITHGRIQNTHIHLRGQNQCLHN